MTIDSRPILVRKLEKSKNTYGAYRRGYVQRPVGEINILGVTDMKTFRMVWDDSIGKTGRFCLLERRGDGRFGRSIGVITVTKKHISIKDQRCALARYFSSEAEKKYKEKDDDFAMVGNE